MKQYRQLVLLGTVNSNLSISGHTCNVDDFKTEPLNEYFGAGNWVITPTAELPADFNPETYTIENGVLVKASAEQIAEREAIAAAAYNEQQRSLREAEYRATTDPQVIELLADATPEIAAIKAQIREKHPYK